MDYDSSHIDKVQLRAGVPMGWQELTAIACGLLTTLILGGTLFNKYWGGENGSITSNEQAWTRMLRSVARVMVLGVGSLPHKSISDHSMNNYIAKLAKHSANRRSG